MELGPHFDLAVESLAKQIWSISPTTTRLHPRCQVSYQIKGRGPESRAWYLSPILKSESLWILPPGHKFLFTLQVSWNPINLTKSSDFGRWLDMSWVTPTWNCYLKFVILYLLKFMRVMTFYVIFYYISVKGSHHSVYWLIVIYWRHMVSQNLVNIGWGNGLLPDGTKPLPEPMLIYHQWGQLTITWGQLH